MAYRRYQRALKLAGASISTTCCLCTERAVHAVRRRAPGRGQSLFAPADRRVSGHQRHSSTASSRRWRRASQSVRGGRRRSVDLRLARGRGLAHPAVSERLARGQGRASRGQLSLDAADLGAGQSADCAQQNAARQSAAARAARGREAANLAMPGRSGRGQARGRRYSRAASLPVSTAQGLRDSVSHQRTAAAVRNRAAQKRRCPTC